MTLLLLPNLLACISHLDHTYFLPCSVDRAMETIDGLIVESEGGGRSYLKRFKTKKKAHLMPIALLNARTGLDQLDFLLAPVIGGETWGILSDAGLPCLADPGSALIFRARQLNIAVEAFSGPSAITLALMLSGLSGQHFTFHGYISRHPEWQLKSWQKTSQKEKSTQIFIETPYRNQGTFKECLKILDLNTLFCVATDLTLSTQEVRIHPISVWRELPAPLLSKRPTIFLFSPPFRSRGSDIRR